MDLTKELGGCLGILVSDSSNLHIKMHEDNVGALTLGKSEPHQMTLRSKHYATKYHWFCTEIEPHQLLLRKIETSQQLGDICTQCLARVTFERLQKKLMGWYLHYISFGGCSSYAR